MRVFNFSAGPAMLPLPVLEQVRDELVDGGGDAREVVHVKGLEQSAYDSRAASSMALAYATSDIGAHHTRAWTIAKEVEQGSN